MSAKADWKDYCEDGNYGIGEYYEYLYELEHLNPQEHLKYRKKRF